MLNKANTLRRRIKGWRGLGRSGIANLKGACNSICIYIQAARHGENAGQSGHGGSVGATAVHFRLRRISTAVKSISGAIGLPWNDPLWADAPINTAEFPYLYTSVSSSVMESSLRSPDLSAPRMADLSSRDPLSSSIHVCILENCVERICFQ
jgi:hypothetical protein